MTDTPEPQPSPPIARLPMMALLVLGGAVVVGSFFFGAPPRQVAPSDSEAMRLFLESLGPLAIVEACVAVALGALLVTGCLRYEAPVLPGGTDAMRARRPLVLLLVLAVLHLVPLPAGLLGIVAPFSAETYASLTSADDTAARPLSLWPAGTWHAIYTLAAMLAASVAVWTVVRARTATGDLRGAARTGAAVLAFVLVLAVLESAYGLYETRFGDDAILGFGKVSNKESVTGTFIHRLMLAVWAGMGICAAVGLTVGALVGGDRHGRGKKTAAAVGLLGCAALCAAAGVFANARLGHLALACAGVALVVLLAPVVARTAGRKWAAGMVGLLALGGAGVALGALRSEAIRERFSHLFRAGGLHDPRFTAWSSTIELWREAPIVGTGIGSYGRAIHLTQSVDNPEELWFAHSDPLNLLSDAGVIGFLLGAWWLVAMIRRGLPAVRHADPRVASVAGGALAAAVVVLTASLGDFQTQFPVVAIPFAALLTLPAALASGAREDTSVALRTRPWILPPRGLAAVGGVLLAGMAVVPLWRAADRSRLRDLAHPPAPTEAERLLHEGHAALLAAPKASPEERPALLELAEERLRAATARDPLLDEAHLWLAHASFLLERDRDDVLRSLGRARIVSRGHAEVNAQIGVTYLLLLGTGPAPHGPEGDSALLALREAGALKPGLFSQAWALCEKRNLPLAERMAVVPDRAHAQMTLGEYLLARGDEARATDAFTRALELEPWDPQTVHRAADIYRRTGREDEGRAVFERVGAEWPEAP